MQSARPIETDIVLLGAGHAHVEVLRRFAMRPEPGVRLTLISREAETPYSGMLPGLIRNDYSHQQAHIDLAPLTAMANARLILAEATAFDPGARTITVRGRPEVPFDLLSVDVGGLPLVPDDGGIGVKADRRFPRPAAPSGGGASRRRPGGDRRRRVPLVWSLPWPWLSASAPGCGWCWSQPPPIRSRRRHRRHAGSCARRCSTATSSWSAA